jgi:DMSO/TMAO reductase YedYZ molybdopterin-dependent catalytic subunit
MMEANEARRNRRGWIGFAAGLMAGVAATGIVLWLNVAFGGVSLPEAVGAALTLLLPVSWFDALHHLLGVDAKHDLFFLLLVGQCLVFALSGALFQRIVTPAGHQIKWSQGFLLALLLWLLTGLILLPITGAGIFGAQLQARLGIGLLSLTIVGVAFAVLLVLLQRWLMARFPAQPAEQAPERQTRRGEESVSTLSRRTLVKGGVALVALAGVGAGLWRLLSEAASASKVPVAQLLHGYTAKIVPPPRPNYGKLQPIAGLSPEITSNDDYYFVSKNLFADPTIDANTWQLTVDGQVDHPFTLTYQQALAEPMQRQYESMLCISNDVGGPYMSNALWEGIPLRHLLQRAGVKPGATKVVFSAADNYSDSLHLTKALETTTLLALQMNGVALPQEHGFPARLLVPGLYGMKHAKWITHIEVVNYNYQGYWQQRGWTDAAGVHLTSRIDTPSDGAQLAARRPTFIAGVAFSGDQGISEVDVSTDAGKTWQRATLKEPLSSLTWVLWELAWQPPVGTSIVTVRAIDLQGNVQSPQTAPPLPDGSSGYHSITVSAV